MYLNSSTQGGSEIYIHFIIGIISYPIIKGLCFPGKS